MFVLFAKMFYVEFGQRVAQIIAVDMIFRRCRYAKNEITVIFMFDICLMCMNRLRSKKTFMRKIDVSTKCFH